MEDILYIAKNFGLNLKTYKKKKSYYILNTSNGIYKLSKSLNTAEEIEFFYEVKEMVSEAGFGTDNFLLSIHHKPYFLYSDSVYVMSFYNELRQSDFSNDEEFKIIIMNLAALHKSLTNIKFKSKKIYLDKEIVFNLEKKYKRFNSIKKMIKQQARLSDFDIYYIKNFDFYKSKIQRTIDTLKQSNVSEIMMCAENSNSVCHLCLKEEKISFGDHIYFQDFSDAKIAPHIFDLIFIIDRYIKAVPKNNISINEILDLYLKHNSKMDSRDLKLIYPLMDFPNRYLKLCDRYYSKKRTWAPISMIKKMDYIKNEYDTYLEYINNIRF